MRDGKRFGIGRYPVTKAIDSQLTERLSPKTIKCLLEGLDEIKRESGFGSLTLVIRFGEVVILEVTQSIKGKREVSNGSKTGESNRINLPTT